MKTTDGVVKHGVHQGDLAASFICDIGGMMKLLWEDRSKKKVLHLRTSIGGGLRPCGVSGALANESRIALYELLPSFSGVHGRLLWFGVTLVP